MTPIEVAKYLENLRLSLAMTAELKRQATKPRAVLTRDYRTGWSATFHGRVQAGQADGRPFFMPQNEAIPLPWGAQERCETVARDIADRFPDCAIVVAI